MQTVHQFSPDDAHTWHCWLPLAKPSLDCAVRCHAACAALLLLFRVQTAINYLAIPAILAMLAYAAVSFPEQTADSVYAVLEFVKEHPTASSIGIIVGAGALLGPDLLAGTAVAGEQPEVFGGWGRRSGGKTVPLSHPPT
jgi:hypothetical protein